MRRFRRRLAAVVLTSLTGIALVAPAAWAAPSPYPYGPDTCNPGHVWREATPGDHVCVVPARREQARRDNAQEAARRTGGPGSCRPGFVPRAATPGDLVCVEPPVRDQAEDDNKQAPNRWTATSRPGDGFLIHPWRDPTQTYRLTSSHTRAPQRLILGVVGGRAGDGTGMDVWTNTSGKHQRFQFRRPGNGVAFQNGFEIVVQHTQKCLEVYNFDQANGARVVQWTCHGGPNQRWYLNKRAEGNAVWELRAMHSNKCLDVFNQRNAADPGNILIQFDCHGRNNQAWNLQAVSG